VETEVRQASRYLDVQAQIGISKHQGGYPATDRLLGMCHLVDGCRVLYVGSGIGVGPAYLARAHGCRVTALDVSAPMLRWTRIRARRDRVSALVTTLQADVRAMPFPDGQFDVVLVEAVLAFVQDKQAAIRECVRVTRGGGWVGMNEVVWRDQPPQGDQLAAANALGTWLPGYAGWRDLQHASGVVDLTCELHDFDLAQETRSRLQWIGWRWLIPAWGRALRIAATDPAARRQLRVQLGYPADLMGLMGYALSAGRKPVPGERSFG
jgi:SAM-dependent methyltransferase